MSRTLIVIVNYRTPALVVECLRSLERDRNTAAQVVIVDVSLDESPRQLTVAIETNGWSSWVSLLPLERNGGYSYGNNEAIRPALSGETRPDYVMLLNPDTIVGEGAVTALERFLDEHTEAGIVGASLFDGAGRRQCSAFQRFSPLGELDRGARLGVLSRVLSRWSVVLPLRDEPVRCHWVSGAAMMVRRQVFETIGLLDEGYFLYFDEADFCRRAHEAGFSIWSVPAARVLHLEGASTGIGASRQRRKPYWYESRRRYFVKAYGVPGLVCADVLWALGRLTLSVRRLLRLGGDVSGDPARFAGDLLLGDLKALLTGRVWSIR